MSKGLHTHRFHGNPEEQRFAEAWDRATGHPRFLDSLLTSRDEHGRILPASERDEQVAATVIQWLGSPVGQGFLRDLGYVRLTVSTPDDWKEPLP